MKQQSILLLFFTCILINRRIQRNSSITLQAHRIFLSQQELIVLGQNQNEKIQSYLSSMQQSDTLENKEQLDDQLETMNQEGSEAPSGNIEMPNYDQPRLPENEQNQLKEEETGYYLTNLFKSTNQYFYDDQNYQKQKLIEDHETAKGEFHQTIQNSSVTPYHIQELEQQYNNPSFPDQPLAEDQPNLLNEYDYIPKDDTRRKQIDSDAFDLNYQKRQNYLNYPSMDELDHKKELFQDEKFRSILSKNQDIDESEGVYHDQDAQFQMQDNLDREEASLAQQNRPLNDAELQQMLAQQNVNFNPSIVRDSDQRRDAQNPSVNVIFYVTPEDLLGGNKYFPPGQYSLEQDQNLGKAYQSGNCIYMKQLGIELGPIKLKINQPQAQLLEPQINPPDLRQPQQLRNNQPDLSQPIQSERIIRELEQPLQSERMLRELEQPQIKPPNLKQPLQTQIRSHEFSQPEQLKQSEEIAQAEKRQIIIQEQQIVFGIHVFKEDYNHSEQNITIQQNPDRHLLESLFQGVQQEQKDNFREARYMLLLSSCQMFLVSGVVCFTFITGDFQFQVYENVFLIVFYFLTFVMMAFVYPFCIDKVKIKFIKFALFFSMGVFFGLTLASLSSFAVLEYKSSGYDQVYMDYPNTGQIYGMWPGNTGFNMLAAIPCFLTHTVKLIHFFFAFLISFLAPLILYSMTASGFFGGYEFGIYFTSWAISQSISIITYYTLKMLRKRLAKGQGEFQIASYSLTFSLVLPGIFKEILAQFPEY